MNNGLADPLWFCHYSLFIIQVVLRHAPYPFDKLQESKATLFPPGFDDILFQSYYVEYHFALIIHAVAV